MLIAFHKPYGVLSQFTAEQPGQRTLADFGLPKGVYPIGRLDADSEGLLLLSDESEWNARLLHPRQAHPREYWAEVERVPDAQTLARLATGPLVQGRRCRPCRVWILEPPPDLPPRQPPIRFRKSVPTCWLALELVEGRNRQVRRMTAAVGIRPCAWCGCASVGSGWARCSRENGNRWAKPNAPWCCAAEPSETGAIRGAVKFCAGCRFGPPNAATPGPIRAASSPRWRS